MQVLLQKEETFTAALGDKTIHGMILADSWRGMQCLLDAEGGELILDNGVFVRADGALAEKLGATPLPVPLIAALLRPSETYAGISIEEDGSLYHLIVAAGEAVDVAWQESLAWAESIGAHLPTRREQRLLFANAKHAFQDRAYWSCEQHADYSGNAWSQDFDGGGQYDWNKDTKLCARAVRKLPI